MRRAVVLLPLLVLAGCSGEAKNEEAIPKSENVIPWIARRPASPMPGLAPPCTVAQLRSRIYLQGATGSLAGPIIVRNIGRTACAFPARIRHAYILGARVSVRLLKTSPDAFAEEDPRANPASRLRALPPGAAANAIVVWSNLCASPPRKTLVVTLERALDLRLRLPKSGPRCDAPTVPSGLSITPFRLRTATPPPSTHLPLRVAILGSPAPPGYKPGEPYLHGQPGSVLRYRVAITNTSKAPFRFDACPMYVQTFIGFHIRSQRYVLNCEAVQTLAPRERAVFAMQMRVPKRAKGLTGITWELAPGSRGSHWSPAEVILG